MAEKKNALLLFTKAPAPGVTKTRLTEERGGIFTPEEAADFYQAMLLDVADIGCQALSRLNRELSSDDENINEYDFVISCPSENDQKKLTELIIQEDAKLLPKLFINDHGGTFDEHFDDAFRQLFQMGYHSVVSVGGDLPTLSVDHIIEAFRWLEKFDASSERGGFVQAPCQECGVSLVGYTGQTPMDARGVFYNLNGIPALDAYIAKAAEKGVPAAYLTPVADVDNTGDLAHSISLLRAMAYSSKYQPDLLWAKRTLTWIDEAGIVISTPPNTLHDPRENVDVN
ncbi:MAG: DUF2064 domain-containing protein [Dehalobacterium sp.]